jgi:hypothetical protein
MSIGLVVGDEHLKKFIEVTNGLSEKYAKHLEGWMDSPFSWILTLPSRTRGAVGEEIVATWLVSNGCKVARAGQSGFDRIVNNVNIEIKFSTLWKSGGFKFQQLRDQDYAYVFCLGVSPATVQAWLIPKAIAWEHATPQHGGAIGKDTKWLCFQADSPPKWMSDYGGSLAEALTARGASRGWA